MNGRSRITLTVVLLALLQLDNGCSVFQNRIEVVGSKKFKKQVDAALSLLRSKSPDAYKLTVKYIRKIEEKERSGMWVYRNPPTLDLADTTAFYSITWCASCIAHDAFHSKLYSDYRVTHTGKPPRDIYSGAHAERLCLDYQLRILQAIDAPQKEIAHVDPSDSLFFDSNGNGEYDWEDYRAHKW